MVVLLNSFEKLTWATVGLGRLLAMTNSSAGVSLVEPCIADSGLRRLQLLTCNSTMLLLQRSLDVASAEIGGFGHPDWLQLDTYFDTERLRQSLRPDALVTSQTMSILRVVAVESGDLPSSPANSVHPGSATSRGHLRQTQCWIRRAA